MATKYPCLALWDRDNPDVKHAVYSTPYYQLLINKAPMVIQVMVFNPQIWAYLEKYGVVDLAKRQEIEVGNYKFDIIKG